jgi:hypothetical protein
MYKTFTKALFLVATQMEYYPMLISSRIDNKSGYIHTAMTMNPQKIYPVMGRNLTVVSERSHFQEYM